MVERLALALLLIVLSACRPDEIRPTVVVEGLLIAGQPASVRVFLLNDFQAFNAQGAEVRVIRDDGASVVLSVDAHSQTTWADAFGEMIIENERAYRIEVDHNGITVSAETTVPPPINIVQVSTTTIPVNSESLGQPIFTVLWTANTQVSRVLTLQEPEGGDVIPFTVPSGNFSNQFRLPVPGQGTTLWDIDFRYYGEHVLRIFTISKDFEDVFFYTPSDGGEQLTRGPSNVQNGAGFFTGASTYEIEIEIVQ